MQNKIKSIPTEPVVVVGGGWSGLATACYLASQNIPVTVLESAKQLGGRARKTSSRTQVLDNGQHLMLGAYREMLDLLKLINVREDEVFLRTPQLLKLVNGKYLETLLELKLPRLPSPLNLLAGMMFCQGLQPKEKFSTLLQFDRLLKKPLSIDNDITVDELLDQASLPKNYRELLDSLCLAALNTPASKASALTFQNVLNETFNGPASNTDLLIPAVNLGNVLPLPASVYLNSRPAEIQYATRAEKLSVNEDTILVNCKDQEFTASAIVLATPPNTSSELLKPFEECNELCHHLDQFRYEPITTVYLRYDESCQIPENMIGLRGTMSEWVFDRRVCDQPGMIAVVISSDGPHMELENKDLSLAIRNELAVIYPDWPQPQASWVIREKRATISCTPEANTHRPGSRTPVEAVFLSGDYVVNDSLYLPATLETAIRNAKSCAEEVVKYLNSKTS